MGSVVCDGECRLNMLKNALIAIVGVLTLKHFREKRRARRAVAY
jgi:hypothetical protein